MLWFAVICSIILLPLLLLRLKYLFGFFARAVRVVAEVLQVDLAGNSVFVKCRYRLDDVEYEWICSAPKRMAGEFRKGDRMPVLVDPKSPSSCVIESQYI
jgi:hypothetical protein